MKLNGRQKHILIYMVASAVICTFTMSSILFMKPGPEELTWVWPTLQQTQDFFVRALPVTVPFGMVTGLLAGLATLPNKPKDQIRMNILRERVMEHLRETDPKTNEFILLFEWAGRLGWKGVEASVRLNPEKWPYASKLLVHDAEIIPFKRKS